MATSVKTYIVNELGKSRLLLEELITSVQLLDQVADTVDRCVIAIKRGNKVLFAGNGGSAADAQHWAAELTGRFNYDRPALPGIALTTDTSALTAIGNDLGYDRVFARQLEAMGRPGDVLFVISTSGNSKNIISAIEVAKSISIDVIGFTGRKGGAIAAECSVCLRIPSDETPKIQEGHEVLGHIICGLIERELFPHACN